MIISHSDLYAQQRAVSQKERIVHGSIVGIVRDSASQSPLEGVNLAIESTTHQTFSDTNGHFVLSHVLPGNYKLSAFALGYELVVLDNIKVIKGRNTQMDIFLPKIPPPSVEEAREELAQGIVHLWVVGLIANNSIPDSSHSSKYGFQYTWIGCVDYDAKEHNAIVREYLDKRNGVGWQEKLQAEWEAYLRTH